MFRYKLLEVNNIIENGSSYTDSCIVRNQLTGEILKINNNSALEEKLKIIEFIDLNDLIIGDEFIKIYD